LGVFCLTADKKEQLLWVRVFQNVEELRGALAEFRERYNQRWIEGRSGAAHGFGLRQTKGRPASMR
jgi:hypothetical protein